MISRLASLIHGRTWAGLGLALSLGAASPAAAASYQIVHSFTNGADGRSPKFVVAGPRGTLFVVVQEAPGGESILKFTPPIAGSTTWSETPIFYQPYGFGNQYLSLIVDPVGNLYGTTNGGGSQNFGTVFELSPPAPGQTSWTQTTLYSFANNKTSGLNQELSYRDSSGVLYGTTEFGGAAKRGTVFRLAPLTSDPRRWRLTELTAFGLAGNPDDGLVAFGLTAGPGGIFYGSTSYGGTDGGGTLYQLTRPAAGQTSWTRRTLTNFAASHNGSYPQASDPVWNPKVDRASNVFGVTFNGGSSDVGTVYRTSPPAAGGTGWTMTFLHEFTSFPDGANPSGPLVEDAAGRLFGTTLWGGSKLGPCAQGNGCGTVFQLTSRGLGGQLTPWNEVILHTFTGIPDGSAPRSLIANTLPDGTQALFGITEVGGSPNPNQPNYGYGTLFEIVP